MFVIFEDVLSTGFAQSTCRRVETEDSDSDTYIDEIDTDIDEIDTDIDETKTDNDTYSCECPVCWEDKPQNPNTECNICSKCQNDDLFLTKFQVGANIREFRDKGDNMIVSCACGDKKCNTSIHILKQTFTIEQEETLSQLSEIKVVSSGIDSRIRSLPTDSSKILATAVSRLIQSTCPICSTSGIVRGCPSITCCNSGCMTKFCGYCAKEGIAKIEGDAGKGGKISYVKDMHQHLRTEHGGFAELARDEASRFVKAMADAQKKDRDIVLEALSPEISEFKDANDNIDNNGNFVVGAVEDDWHPPHNLRQVNRQPFDNFEEQMLELQEEYGFSNYVYETLLYWWDEGDPRIGRIRDHFEYWRDWDDEIEAEVMELLDEIEPTSHGDGDEEFSDFIRMSSNWEVIDDLEYMWKRGDPQISKIHKEFQEGFIENAKKLLVKLISEIKGDTDDYD